MNIVFTTTGDIKNPKQAALKKPLFLLPKKRPRPQTPPPTKRPTLTPQPPHNQNQKQTGKRIDKTPGKCYKKRAEWKGTGKSRSEPLQIMEIENIFWRSGKIKQPFALSSHLKSALLVTRSGKFPESEPLHGPFSTSSGKSFPHTDLISTLSSHNLAHFGHTYVTHDL